MIRAVCTAIYVNTSIIEKMVDMKSHCDVSVVCANYNNGPYLDAFFNAFENATHHPKELIFVDDGSTDNSLEIVKKFAARVPYLIVIPLGQNQGFGNALNAGIVRATGNFIMRIDPDDIMLPGRIIAQSNLLSDGQFDVVGSNAEIFHSQTGKVLGKTNFPLTHSAIAKKICAGEHGVLHPTVMARAELFKAQPYVQAHVPAEDYDIFARMLSAGARFTNIDEPLLRYRVHEKSASNILPFSTIEKTYKLRDQIFSTKTSKFWIFAYFMHIKFYRKSLFARNKLRRLAYLLISTACYPSKFLLRIKKIIFGSCGAGGAK